MFALFFSLYLSMFRGSWFLYTPQIIMELTKNSINGLGQFFTSIFGEGQPMTNLGDILLASQGSTDVFPALYSLIALVLSLITSIGIFVVATKGIKKIFTVFFYGVR